MERKSAEKRADQEKNLGYPDAEEKITGEKKGGCKPFSLDKAVKFYSEANLLKLHRFVSSWSTKQKRQKRPLENGMDGNNFAQVARKLKKMCPKP